MKRYIAAIVAILILITVLFALPVAAEESVESGQSGTSVPTENVTEEVIFPDGEDTLPVADDTMSFSEVVLAYAEYYNISMADAEKMISGLRGLGDKYLADSDLWDVIVLDMDEHPARWTLIGLLLALALTLIGLLIKRVINDATSIARIKVSVANLDEAINGDGKDADGRGLSIRAMINEKNGHIELLEKENEALAAKAGELSEVIGTLKEAIGKMETNSDASLKITEESALQIVQLLSIALDRKVPILSAEARQIWTANAQERIKNLYSGEEADDDGQNGEAGQTV